jgi:hypothetical protein
MGEILHTSRIKIVRVKGPTRKAMVEGFDEPIYYGVRRHQALLQRRA